MNLKTMPTRLGSSCVVVIGIAGVVGVLLSVLAMSNGLEESITNTGSGDRIIVMRDGANFEQASFIPIGELQLILTTPGIARTSDGKPAASIEMLTTVNVQRSGDDTTVDISVRGIDLERLEIRPDIELVSGRLCRTGLREVIVGELARQEFKNLDIGDVISIRSDQWEIVGVFTSGGSLDSGFLTDANTLMAAFEQTSANSVVLILEEGETVDSFQESLTGNTNLLLKATEEREYYKRAAQNISRLMFVVTNVVAAIMALGALFGALNTMYSAVSSRGVEIATLRAIGFGSTGVVVSVLMEALILALAGAILGASLAWLFFSGDLVSVSSIVFELELTPQMLVTGIAWACGVGFIGGLFPAIRAARLPIVSALREL